MNEEKEVIRKNFKDEVIQVMRKWIMCMSITEEDELVYDYRAAADDITELHDKEISEKDNRIKELAREEMWAEFGIHPDKNGEFPTAEEYLVYQRRARGLNERFSPYDLRLCDEFENRFC